jgi:hypothetical protein
MHVLVLPGLPRRFVISTVASLVAIASLLLVGVPTASATDPAVWIGSPVEGHWPANEYKNGQWDCYLSTTYPSDSCSLPYAHHSFRYGDPYVGDWAADLQGVSTSTPVKVFAAPQNTALSINARIENVKYACAARPGESSASRLARGGKAVVVGFYHGSTKIGTAKYVHIKPVSSVYPGKGIKRWNRIIGYPGNYTVNSCWGGVHVHFEMTSWVHYACYNKGYYPRPTSSSALTHAPSIIHESNFLGFIGGNYASSPRKRCP